MTKMCWKVCYEKLTIAYGKPKHAEQAQVYFEALEDLRDERVVLAVAQVIRTVKYFPSPAEIREQASLLAAAEARNVDPVPNYPPLSDEQTANLVKMVREAKAKIFGSTQ